MVLYKQTISHTDYSLTKQLVEMAPKTSVLWNYFTVVEGLYIYPILKVTLSVCLCVFDYYFGEQ